MSSSSGGSGSTASMREEEGNPLTDQVHSEETLNKQQQQNHHHHQRNKLADCVSDDSPASFGGVEEEVREEELETPKQAIFKDASTNFTEENKMASNVITINGSEATIHRGEQNVSLEEKNGGKAFSGGRVERSGFENLGFVDDEAHTVAKESAVGSSSGKVVNGGGGGGLSPQSPPLPRPHSPAGPFLESVVAVTPTPSGGVNGRRPIHETPNLSIHNTSGLIMTPNDKEKSDTGANVTEAVNLELVNMNPYGGAGLGVSDEVGGGKTGTNGGLNGIPVKSGASDEETGDGGFSDPYDEYFVPVNEHRKYIRGEKLYVTKDRRRSQSWRRCICWAVGFTLLAVAILIAVLAGTGVILAQEDEGKSVEARSFGGADSIPHVAESKDPNAPNEKDKLVPPEESSSYTPPPSLSSVPITPPTTQMNTFNVPRVLEAEMTIDSLSFEPDLLNSSSSQFKELSGILEKELKLALFDDQFLMNGPADMFIKVLSFQSGSIVARFHIGWRFKDSFPMAHDPIDKESLKDRIEAYLLNNGGYLYVYHIAPGTFKSSYVLDLCQVDNGGCSHDCKYNYEDANFECSCPSGLFLDNLKKTCVTELTDVIILTTSTKAPLFEDSPWIPIQPKEHEVVPEREESSKGGHVESGKVNHNEQDMHEETKDRDNIYKNHQDHIHSVFTNKTEEDLETMGLETEDKEHKMDDSLHSEHVPEAKEVVEEKNHEEHQFTMSVGTAKSSTGGSILIEDSSEEPPRDDEHENDAESDEELHTVYKEQGFRGHKDKEPGENGRTSESEEKPSSEEMEKLGHSVDSSENTSQEVHDSKEIGDKVSIEHSVSIEMSEGGEIVDSLDDKYNHSSHSLFNELHAHMIETTTSDNLHVNVLEPNGSMDGFEGDKHILENKTHSPDNAHELSKDSDLVVSILPSKEEIVSAVEYATVKDENETLKLVDGRVEEKEKMEGGEHNSSESDTFDMSRKKVVDNVEEAVGQLEERITMEESTMNYGKEGVVTEKPNEVMHGEEHNKGGMLEENVGNKKEDGALEHHDIGEMEPAEDEKSVEGDKDDDSIEHHVEMIQSDMHGMEHKIGGVVEPNEEEMVTHDGSISEDAEKPDTAEEKGSLNTSPDEGEDEKMSEEKDKNGESHVPVVIMHDENDVGNHEINPNTVKIQGVVDDVVDGDNEETGRGMNERVEEITQKSLIEGIDHDVEFGMNSRGMALSAMNHEKETEDVNIGKMLKSNENLNIGITPVMIDHVDSVEENSETEMESSTVSMFGENEADVDTEKTNKKGSEGDSLWEMQGIVKEMDESNVHSTEENLTEGDLGIGHDGNESPAVELEVSTKDYKENKTIFEENEKEMEEGRFLNDNSSDKSNTREGMFSGHMEDAVTALSDDVSLSNVLEGTDDDLKSKGGKQESENDSEHNISKGEIQKFDIHHITANISTPLPNVDILNDDEDPNIVPIEENAKEMIGDDFDAKQISPAIEVKIMGLDEDRGTTTEEKPVSDMPIMKDDHQDTSEIVLMTLSGGIASEHLDKTNEMPLGNEMEVAVLSSTTASTAENSIENISNQYNSSNEANVMPSVEIYQIEHAAIARNESSVTMATPSPKENNIDDPPLHLQAGMSVVVSEESSLVSTSTSEPVIERITSIPDHEVKASPEENDSEKEGNITEMFVSTSEGKEKASDTEENLKEEVLKDIGHVSLTISESGSSEKPLEKEEKMVEVDVAGLEIVDSSSAKSEEKGKSIPDGKDEEASSISSINQDFSIEHANTVHALSPTSPSTIIDETPKTESISDAIIPKLLHNPDIRALDGAITKDGSKVPEPDLPFETDDNERSNNLATLDNEDSLSVREGGSEAIVKVGAVDIGLKSTTEHMNEILTIPVFSTWPGTALEVNNLTSEAEKITGIMEDGHKIQSENLKEKGDMMKIDSFEIPMKKKGEFKKPIHPEEEIMKPLFGKEGKDSSSKVDKIGLLSPMSSSTAKDDLNAEMTSKEMVSFLITTTEIPLISEQNGETERILDAEVGFTSSSALTEKGGEKLNTIGESESGSKKDLGKVLGKETTKVDELTSKSEEEKEEDVSTIDVTTEPESTTQDHKGVLLINNEGDREENAKEIVPKSDEFKESEINPTDVSIKEEVTAATIEEEEIDSSQKKSIEPVAKEVEEVTLMTDDEVTRVSVNEMGAVVPTTTEEVQEKVQELLKEMGGYGEGGHKVVSKSGVEQFVDGPKEIHKNSSTSDKIAISVSSNLTSSNAISSILIPITSSPIRAEDENQLQTSLPPKDETTKVDMNNKLEVNVTNEEIIHNETDVLKNENTSSEGSSITMPIHEMVSSESLTLPPSPNSVSSTVPSVSTDISYTKDAEEITTMHEILEMTTLNSMLDVVMETLKSDSVDFITTLRQPEILMKENSSHIVDTEYKKEVDAANVMGFSHIGNNVSESENGTSGKTSENQWFEKEQNSLRNASNTTASTLPEIDQQFFSKCTSGQFQCTNGTSLTPHSVMPISSSYVASLATGVACVPLSAKCDSINDCSDGSDELGCIEDGCPGNFQCSNGQCLKRHLVCNGIIDCNDASDEDNCEKWQCQFDEFQCPSGRCIPVLWLCDGKPDCDNHTDEYTCQESCGNNEYLCPEGWCIPMSWRCNGLPECANGEDEKLCDCSLEQVKCGTGGCVARAEVCDGVDHCPDQSDEWGCVQLHNETMKLEVRTTENKWLSVCADRWDNNWSNFVCQSFGYSRAIFTEYPAAGDLDGSSEVFILKPDASIMVPSGNSIRVPGVLQQASSSLCSSGSIVEISCQEFTCGNHGLADGVAARLVGGDEAANGQWPSVALLYHTRHRSTCTASIISPRWLIASYNCLHMREKSLSPEGWVAFGGGSTFDKDKPETQIQSVRSIVPYPQVKYNRFLYNHDVALVELMEPLAFTQSVGAICLPEKPIEPRQLCVTAGWGYTSPGEINFSQYLHYLPLPTIDLNECNSSKHYAGFITEDKICAGFTDAMHSPCYNDEGAPLMCVSEGGIWELQGVLSYHSNCGRGYHPSIFSSVTAVRDWMKKVVGGRFERRSTFNVRRRRSRNSYERTANIIWS